MHSYHSPEDLEPLSRSDPDLWREIYGYMQVCLYEDDEADLSFRVASIEDLPEVEALGVAEETDLTGAASRDGGRKGCSW